MELKLKNYIVIALMTSFLAVGILHVDELLSPLLQPTGNRGFSFLGFISLAVYFAAGANVKAGLKSFRSVCSALLMALTFIVLTGILQSFVGGLALDLALIITLVIALPVFDLYSNLTFPPANFIFMGTTFALLTYVPGMTFKIVAVNMLIYNVIGSVCGFLTMYARVKYESIIAAKQEVGNQELI